MKVYCKHCKWLDFHLHGDYYTKCMYPENKRVERMVEDWYQKTLLINYSGDKPEEINKNNDCKWYTELTNADKSINRLLST